MKQNDLSLLFHCCFTLALTALGETALLPSHTNLDVNLINHRFTGLHGFSEGWAYSQGSYGDYIDSSHVGYYHARKPHETSRKYETKRPVPGVSRRFIHPGESNTHNDSRLQEC